MSSRTRSAGAIAAGSNARLRPSTARPIGRLTRKIQCQLRLSVSTPPSNTPMLPPLAQTKPYTPIALARSAGSVNRFISKASATASTIAPPMPCTARAMTSGTCALDQPQASEASVNSVMPIMKRRRCP